MPPIAACLAVSMPELANRSEMFSSCRNGLNRRAEITLLSPAIRLQDSVFLD
jgi:hypothetical protein